MSRSSLSVVTGAFGYSGKYIARRLLEQGATVKTLTRTPTSHSPFGDRVEALPLDFGDFNGLVENLREPPLCTTPIGFASHEARLLMTLRFRTPAS